jgi:hypothetical protein
MVVPMKRAVAGAWLVALGLSLACCGGPALRRPETVSPATLRERCWITTDGVSREQAICVARQVGLRDSDAPFHVREATTAVGVKVWVVDEDCETGPADCIGIEIDRRNGTVLETRYLYAVKDYPQKLRE